jgi:hypothetical protein
MAAGEFVVDEEHQTGVHFEGMPAEGTGLCVYRVVEGKIARMMVLL